MKKDEFIKKLSDNGLVLNEKQINQLDEYARFLVSYNEKINLTAITEYEDILDKHFYDSLLLSFNFKLEGSLVDVGSGAGFPGVVLKICYPDLFVVLVEPTKKRCVFLEELIAKIGLKGIEVVNQRGEDFSLENREKFDYVTARAVSNLNVLIEVCGALVKLNGYFVSLRGSSGLEELEVAKKAIKSMGFEVESTIKKELYCGSNRIISYLKKVKETPKKFPRKYSIIKQKSL